MEFCKIHRKTPGLSPASLFEKRLRNSTCETFKNTFFTKQLWATASDLSSFSKQLFSEPLWMFITSYMLKYIKVLVLVKQSPKLNILGGLLAFYKSFSFHFFYKLYKSKRCFLKFSIEDTADHISLKEHGRVW